MGGTTLTMVKEAAPLVLTASHDTTAKIWETSTGECKQTFSGHTKRLWSAVFSADGLSVLTASDDTTAKMWETSTSECKQTFSHRTDLGHTKVLRSAVFSADG